MSLADLERQACSRRGDALGWLIDQVHIERPANAIAGQVLQRHIDHQMECARPPRLGRSETPARFLSVNGNRSCNFTRRAVNVNDVLQQRLVQRPGEIYL